VTPAAHSASNSGQQLMPPSIPPIIPYGNLWLAVAPSSMVTRRADDKTALGGHAFISLAYAARCGGIMRRIPAYWQWRADTLIRCARRREPPRFSRAGPPLPHVRCSCAAAPGRKRTSAGSNAPSLPGCIIAWVGVSKYLGAQRRARTGATTTRTLLPFMTTNGVSWDRASLTNLHLTPAADAWALLLLSNRHLDIVIVAEDTHHPCLYYSRAGHRTYVNASSSWRGDHHAGETVGAAWTGRRADP